MVGTLACDRRTTTCCSPTPGPSPAAGLVVFGGAGFAGEGGRAAFRDIVRRPAPDDNLLFPHPRPLPRDGVGCVWRGWFRGRGGTWFFFVTLGIHLRWLPRARIESPFRACACDRRNDNLIFPHPRPLPRGGVVCAWRSWFRGRGGTCGFWRHRSQASDGRQLDFPPPPAPPPRRGCLCWAGLVSRERGDLGRQRLLGRGALRWSFAGGAVCVICVVDVPPLGVGGGVAMAAGCCRSRFALALSPAPSKCPPKCRLLSV